MMPILLSEANKCLPRRGVLTFTLPILVLHKHGYAHSVDSDALAVSTADSYASNPAGWSSAFDATDGIYLSLLSGTFNIENPSIGSQY